MEFAGEWKVCSDGVPRPMIRLEVQGADGSFPLEYFHIDSGSDRTVLSAYFNLTLRLSSTAPPSATLSGIGGGAGPFIRATTVLHFKSVTGLIVPLSQPFAVFTNLQSSDYSLLGRDILDIFDVIFEHGRGPIRLHYGTHSYQVIGP